MTQSWQTQVWQRKGLWSLLLLPLSLLFWGISFVRRWLYKLGLKKSHRPSIPVIVVGNITVGGSGKTPTVIWLCDLLKSAGYQPGVVSRGYGGKAPHYPMLVTANCSAHESGDEPLLIAQRAGIPVVVDPCRSDAAKLIEEQGCDVIITDDGLQHYALDRDIELVVIDGERRLGNGFLLPAGPLRETAARLNSVFATLCNGGTPRHGEWGMQLKPAAQWHGVFDESRVTQAFFQHKRVLAIAGIGHPQRFFNLLEQLGIEADCKPLADHANVTQEILSQWQQSYDIILMTEKDAVKCKAFSPSPCFYLPVEATLDAKLGGSILNKLKSLKERSNGI